MRAQRIINADREGWCANCYNRHGKVVRGRNAKGNIPRLTVLLHTEQALVTDADGRSRILTRHFVLSLAGPVS